MSVLLISVLVGAASGAAVYLGISYLVGGLDFLAHEVRSWPTLVSAILCGLLGFAVGTSIESERETKSEFANRYGFAWPDGLHYGRARADVIEIDGKPRTCFLDDNGADGMDLKCLVGDEFETYQP